MIKVLCKDKVQITCIFFKRLLSEKEGIRHTHQLKVYVYRKVGFSMWFFIGDRQRNGLCCKESIRLGGSVAKFLHTQND
ncbi:hypothetical protein COO04_27285 [Bacillus toyonensis]|nr:hypothetical protein COO04_27285 [Bacillus toyonensis]